jgi:hypothetical protein
MTLKLSVPASTVTGRVVEVIRHGHTVSGNPKMSLVLNVERIDDTPAESSTPVTVRIQDDAGLVYEAENAELREHAHTYALTRGGRISHRIRA